MSYGKDFSQSLALAGLGAQSPQATCLPIRAAFLVFPVVWCKNDDFSTQWGVGKAESLAWSICSSLSPAFLAPDSFSNQSYSSKNDFPKPQSGNVSCLLTTSVDSLWPAG